MINPVNISPCIINYIYQGIPKRVILIPGNDFKLAAGIFIQIEIMRYKPKIVVQIGHNC